MTKTNSHDTRPTKDADSLIDESMEFDGTPCPDCGAPIWDQYDHQEDCTLK